MHSRVIAGLPGQPSPNQGSRQTKSKGHPRPFPTGTAPAVFPPSPGPSMNGWPQGSRAPAGAASSAEGLAQLPPRFASAVSLSDGEAHLKISCRCTAMTNTPKLRPTYLDIPIKVPWYCLVVLTPGHWPCAQAQHHCQHSARLLTARPRRATGQHAGEPTWARQVPAARSCVRAPPWTGPLPSQQPLHRALQVISCR